MDDINCTVSVIVPNYNHARFLEQRIESILKQTFTDYELILLDDKSTDNSLQVLNKFKLHDKVSYYNFNNENSGSPFAQWKKGILQAKGKYIWIAESDDCASPNFLEELISKLEQDNTIVYAYTQSMIIDEFNKELYNNVRWTQNFTRNIWKNDFLISGKLFIQNYLSVKNVVPNASAVVFRKSAVNLEWFNFLSQFRMTGDWLFWMQLSQLGKVSFSSKTLNHFRTSSQATRNHNSLVKKRRRVIEEAMVFQHLRNVINHDKLNEKKIDIRIINKWLKINSLTSTFSNSIINKLILKNTGFVLKILLQRQINKLRFFI